MELTHLRATLAGPVPDLILAQWQQLAADHVDTGLYRSFVSFERMFPYQGDDLACAVANTAPHAQVLEEGHPGFHLPSAIDWGAAEGRGTAHRTRRGPRMLRIPFRHGTPGSETGGVGQGRARTMMPTEVYRDALAAIRGDRERRAALSAAGPLLSRPYAAMTGRGLPDLAIRARQQEGHPGYTWRSPLYGGLTYRQQANPETGATSGTWTTFRTLTEDSVGWYIPPFPGAHIAARTADLVRDEVRDLIGAAAREDVVELVRVTVGAG